MSKPQPQQCDGRDRRPLPLPPAVDVEDDLDELCRYIREAPDDHAIVIMMTGLVLTVCASAVAIVVALTSWIGG